MPSFQRYSAFLISCCLMFIACRERYGLPIEKTQQNVLVVEGNILHDDTTIIRLSRTTALAETGLIPETGATVTVEGDDNTRLALTETNAGEYRVNTVDLNPTVKYRINISSAGKVYESAFSEIISTPDIDTLTWVRDNGVEIFIHSTGKADDTRYFKWEYDEVWDFYSLTTSHVYYSITRFNNGTIVCDSQEVDGIMLEKCLEPYIVRGDPYNDSMYHCWKYVSSSRVHLGSTKALSSNVVLQPVRKIENNGFELANLYSILVKQIGLSKDGYDFYRVLQRNTEQLGSIFDAQPSELKTNVFCVSNPAEPVIGFVDVTTIKRKRLFISKDEVEGWDYNPFFGCFLTYDTVPYADARAVDSLIRSNLVPISSATAPSPPHYFVGSFYVMSEQCMDCRVRGVHRKPDFWPY